jgi:hypothetical protein
VNSTGLIYAAVGGPNKRSPAGPMLHIYHAQLCVYLPVCWFIHIETQAVQKKPKPGAARSSSITRFPVLRDTRCSAILPSSAPYQNFMEATQLKASNIPTSKHDLGLEIWHD